MPGSARRFGADVSPLWTGDREAAKGRAPPRSFLACQLKDNGGGSVTLERACVAFMSERYRNGTLLRGAIGGVRSTNVSNLIGVGEYDTYAKTLQAARTRASGARPPPRSMAPGRSPGWYRVPQGRQSWPNPHAARRRAGRPGGCLDRRDLLPAPRGRTAAQRRPGHPGPPPWSCRRGPPGQSSAQAKARVCPTSR